MREQGQSIIPEKGERAFIGGQTGSGKTGLAAWILIRIPFAPIFIYDTKDEPKFLKLPNSIVVTTMAEMKEQYDNPEIDYIIVRPPLDIIDEPKELDKYLLYHYHNFRNSTAYIDEAYTFHINGRAGKGIVALYTRGRSRGITTILSSQRPKGIDRFCITESQKLYILRLADKDDRKRIQDLIPNFADLPLPPKHGFYFYITGEDSPELYKPVKLDAGLNTGYVDEHSDSEDMPNSAGNILDTNPGTKHVWV